MPRDDAPATPVLRLLGSLVIPTLPISARGQADGPGRPDVHVLQAAAQPKRIALVAYLALAAPRGLHQRDHLLALLWPDTDEARARAALSQSLYALRRAFGADVFQKRGQQVGLAPGRLAVDALAFEAALARGDAAAGLALYGGDLLPGFHVARAPAFESWLDSERLRLRQLAQRAAHEASDAAWRQGDLDTAVALARRAWELPGATEDALRHLLALLQEGGDVAGALSVFELHAARLRREDGGEPEPRTLELVRLLRTLEARTAAAELASPAGAAAAATAQSSDAQPSTVRATPAAAAIPGRFARRWWRHAALAAAAMVVIVAGARQLSRSTAPLPSPDAMLVAVLPFTVRGDSALAYMSEGMVDLLSAQLDGAGEIRAVDTRSLLRFVELEPGEPADEAWVARVVDHFQAGMHVTGTLVRTGSGLQATAALRDRTGRVVGRGEASASSEEDLPVLVDDLARGLLSAQFVGPAGRLQRVAVTTTSSFPALKAYLEGEASYRRAQHDQAFAAYGLAVELDSTFALAHYRLALAADWVGASYLIAPSIERAIRFEDRLDDHERRLVHALDRYWSGTFLDAERAYATLLDIYPDDVEAWHQYGEVLFHWGPLMGRSALTAEPSFERVLALNPDDVGALAHLARLAATRGAAGRTDSLVRRLLRVAPDVDRSPEIHLLRAHVTGDSADVRLQHAALSEMSDNNVWTAAWRVAAYARDAVAAAGIVRANLSAERRPESQLVAWQSLAHFAAARGRWSEAGRALEQAARIDPRRALATSAFIAALPFSPVTAAELARLREQLAAPVPGPRVAPAIFAVSLDWEIDRRVLDALLAARAGDAGPARTLLDSLGSGSALETSAQRTMLALSAAAAPAAMRRALVDSLLQPAPRLAIRRDAEFTYAIEHFIIAGLLRDEGRAEDALAWYASFGTDFGYDIAFVAPAHLYRAEILDGLNRRDEAIAEYEAFVRLWDDPDPGLRALRDRARARIAALRPAGG